MLGRTFVRHNWFSLCNLASCNVQTDSHVLIWLCLCWPVVTLQAPTAMPAIKSSCGCTLDQRWQIVPSRWLTCSCCWGKPPVSAWCATFVFLVLLFLTTSVWGAAVSAFCSVWACAPAVPLACSKVHSNALHKVFQMSTKPPTAT